MRLNKIPYFDDVYNLTDREQLMLSYWCMCVEEGTWDVLESFEQDPVMDNDHNSFRRQIKLSHDKFKAMFGINTRSLAKTGIHLAMCIYMNGFGMGYQTCSDKESYSNETISEDCFPFADDEEIAPNNDTTAPKGETK